MIDLKELLENMSLFERNNCFKEGKVSWDDVLLQLNKMLYDVTLHKTLALYIHRCCLVNGAPIDRLTKILMKLGNPEGMLRHLCTFPTAPFDMVLKVISNSKNARCIYDFAHMIESDFKTSLDELEVVGRLPKLYYGYGYDAPDGFYITLWLLRLVPKDNHILYKLLYESLNEGIISDKKMFISFVNSKLIEILKQLGDAISKTNDAEYIECYEADFPGYSQNLALTLMHLYHRNEEIK